jgi:hypothetical protein
MTLEIACLKYYNVSTVYNFLLSADQNIRVDDYIFIWRK